jgi:hypothetical protein
MTQFIETVRVPSHSLTFNLKASIFDLLKTREGTCSKRTGYVVKVCSLDKIVKAFINPADCSNSFIVECTFETFTPQVGVQYGAKTLAIYPEGLICEINQCVTAFITDHDDQEVTVGQFINVKLLEIIFSNGRFKCVGIFLKT